MTAEAASTLSVLKSLGVRPFAPNMGHVSVHCGASVQYIRRRVVRPRPMPDIIHIQICRLRTVLIPPFFTCATLKNGFGTETCPIPDMYEAVIGKVRQLISSVKHLSCTTDAWSDPSSSVALLSLTVHWISDDFIRQQTVLFATPLEESHTGEYLSVKFTEMLDSFSIEKARVHLVLRDSGANMVKALRLAEVDDLPCFAHQLQLVINDSILSQRAVKDILALA